MAGDPGVDEVRRTSEAEPWDEDRVLDAGHALDATSAQDDIPMLAAAWRHFGPYMAIARRIGAVPRQRTWNRDAVLGELRRLARGKRIITADDRGGRPRDRLPCAP